MNRFIALIGLLAFVAFSLMSLVADSGVPEFGTLKTVATTIVFLGVGGMLLGVLAMTFSTTATDKAYCEQTAMAGLVVAVFGAGIFPVMPEKWLMIPACFLLSLAIARIAVRFQKTSLLGHARYSPVLLAMITGFASVWAAAAGWGWLQSASFMLVGIPAALIIVNARAEQPEPIAVAG